MLTKYRMTDAGYEELASNKEQYRNPTVKAKLMHILSSGVGYTLDSLTSQVLTDSRLQNVKSGAIIREAQVLENLGYIEVFNQ